ncbi:MAG TPA: hypothetical protein VL332_01085 [Candidatus Saccharimonadaceae bacterium]|jgi:protein-tyrosine-phosphatase|nr:hypothetical protein [Candidatus Saccharimonadaceae bacterium]
MSDVHFRVLIVCSGNTCRSPLAEAYLRAALGADRDRVQVVSAGTGALDGQPATGPAIEVARRDGVDLAGHRSRRLRIADVAEADLVLVMERLHLNVVRAMGAPADKTHVLSDWPEPGEPELEIFDPFGGSIEAYEECWRRVRRHVERVVPSVREALRTRSA